MAYPHFFFVFLTKRDVIAGTQAFEDDGLSFRALVMNNRAEVLIRLRDVECKRNVLFWAKGRQLSQRL